MNLPSKSILILSPINLSSFNQFQSMSYGHPKRHCAKINSFQSTFSYYNGIMIYIAPTSVKLNSTSSLPQHPVVYHIPPNSSFKKPLNLITSSPSSILKLMFHHVSNKLPDCLLWLTSRLPTTDIFSILLLRYCSKMEYDCIRSREQHLNKL